MYIESVLNLETNDSSGDCSALSSQAVEDKEKPVTFLPHDINSKSGYFRLILIRAFASQLKMILFLKSSIDHYTSWSTLGALDLLPPL